MMRNWEDWAFGLTFAAAIAIALGMNASRAPSFTTDAIAAEQPVKYAMTITAKRLPAECKGLVGKVVPAVCTALLDAQTISVGEAH